MLKTALQHFQKQKIRLAFQLGVVRSFQHAVQYIRPRLDILYRSFWSVLVQQTRDNIGKELAHTKLEHVKRTKHRRQQIAFQHFCPNKSHIIRAHFVQAVETVFQSSKLRFQTLTRRDQLLFLRAGRIAQCLKKGTKTRQKKRKERIRTFKLSRIDDGRSTSFTFLLNISSDYLFFSVQARASIARRRDLKKVKVALQLLFLSTLGRSWRGEGSETRKRWKKTVHLAFPSRSLGKLLRNSFALCYLTVFRRFFFFVMSVFGLVFCALFFDWFGVGPVFVLDAFVFRASVIFMCSSSLILLGVQRRLITVNVARDVAVYSFPIVHQLVIYKLMAGGMKANTAAEQYLGVMMMNNPLVICATSWFTTPSWGKKLYGLVIVFASVSYHGISQFLSATDEVERDIIKQTTAITLFYMIVICSLFVATAKVVTKLLSDADTSRVARETFLNQMSHVSVKKRKTHQSQICNTFLKKDLRSPLAAVIGYTELLKEEGFSKIASDIHECASMALTLVDQVLDWSLVKSGNVKLNMKHIEVGDLLERVKRITAGLNRTTDESSFFVTSLSFNQVKCRGRS